MAKSKSPKLGPKVEILVESRNSDQRSKFRPKLFGQHYEFFVGRNPNTEIRPKSATCIDRINIYFLEYLYHPEYLKIFII